MDEKYPDMTAAHLKAVTKRRRLERKEMQDKIDAEHIEQFYLKYASFIRAAAIKGDDIVRINCHPPGSAAISKDLQKRGFKVFWSDEDDSDDYMLIQWKD